MQHVELFKFDSDTQLAAAATQDWLNELRNHSQAIPYLTAFSGGRIAANFYAELSQKALHYKELLSHMHFFWADERCVPFMHADSNYEAAYRLFFQPLSIPDPHIHRIKGELNPLEAASCASEELLKAAHNQAADRPIFDMVLLGMGEDGHIASIFPGASVDEREFQGCYYATVGPKPPPQRITLSLHCLTRARKVWVLIAGTGKNKALGESLAQPESTPLSWLIHRRSSTRIYHVSS